MSAQSSSQARRNNNRRYGCPTTVFTSARFLERLARQETDSRSPNNTVVFHQSFRCVSTVSWEFGRPAPAALQGFFSGFPSLPARYWLDADHITATTTANLNLTRLFRSLIHKVRTDSLLGHGRCSNLTHLSKARTQPRDKRIGISFRRMTISAILVLLTSLSFYSGDSMRSSQS